MQQSVTRLCLAHLLLWSCRDLVMTNRQLSTQGMRQEVTIGGRTLDTFRSDASKYIDQQQQIKALAATVDCGIVRLRLQV